MFDPDIAYAMKTHPGTKFPFVVCDKDGIPLGYESQEYIEKYKIPIRSTSQEEGGDSMKRLLSAVALVLCLVPSMVFAASATLTWDSNTEADLAGYKVYRGNASGAGTCPVGPLQPLMVNGQPVSLGKVNTYTDTTVPVFDGALCYEITAFDTSANESVRSNRAVKAVNLVPPQAPASLTIGNVVP